MSTKPVLFALMLFGVLVPASMSLSQDESDAAGHPVIVISRNAELKMDDKLLATIPQGEGLQPEKSQENRIYVTWESHSGWLDRKHVLPIRQGIDRLTGMLEANPQDADLLGRLARLRATSPNPESRNGKIAMKEATKACEFTSYKSATVLDTLAAAYAETGQFDRAVDWQTKAVALADASLKKEFQARLDLYSHTQPLREDPVVRYPWDTFTSTDGRYRVQFPGSPEDRVDHPEAMFHQHISTVKVAGKLVFIVGYGDLPADMRKSDPQAERMLKTLVDKMTGQLKTVSERRIAIGNHPGLERRLESQKAETSVFRAFVDGVRVYHLFVAGSTVEMARNTGAIDRFLDSFALTSGTAAEGLHAPDTKASWHEFASDRGRFRIVFPAGKEELTSEPKNGSSIYEYGLATSDGIKFSAGYGDLPAEMEQQYPEVNQRLEELRNRIVKRSGSKLVSDRNLTLIQFPGQEFHGKEIVLEDNGASSVQVLRFYIVHRRFYECSVLAPAARFKPDAAAIRRFLDSFGLLSTASTDGQLAINSVQPCHGAAGPVKQNRVYFPLDNMQFRGNVSGLTRDTQGQPDFAMIPSLYDANGTGLFSDRLRVQSSPAADDAGGTAFDIAVPVPTAAEPGEYTFVLTLKDLLSDREAAFARKIVIRPIELAIVFLEFFRDAEDTVPGPAGGAVNQPFHVRLRAIGYDRRFDRLNTTMQMELFDEQGRRLFNPPLQSNVSNDNPEAVRIADFVTFRAKLKVDRPGQYRLLITVQDKISGKSTSLAVPAFITAATEK